MHMAPAVPPRVQQARQPGWLLRVAALTMMTLALMTGAVQGSDKMMHLHPDWEFVADRVMGGQSTGAVTQSDLTDGGTARLTGNVSLDNNGGFIQMAFDLEDGAAFDASGWAGLTLKVRGNGERYDVRLRTTDLTRPWQSYRTEFTASADWTLLHLPFADFAAHRTEIEFDPAKLRRIGVLAVGRAFAADVTVARVGLYR